MTAAGNDKQSAFDILIQNGANPSFKDNDGLSVLHAAAQGGDASVIMKLLSLALDVNSRSNDGVTPLMTAAGNDKQNACDILTQNGADPSFKDNDGFSLLPLLHHVEIHPLS